MKLSEIIGKQVFSIYNTKFLGTVNEIAFNEKHDKVLGLYFFDQDENEFFIKMQNVYSIKDFVVIKNTTKISNEFMLDKPLSPIGKVVIGIDGKNYGILSDLEFDDKFFITFFITNQDEKIIPKNIITILDNIVVGENVKFCNFKPKYSKSNEDLLKNLTVSVMKMDEPEQKLMPSKLTVNSDILIGKKLSKDIIGKNNELILKQNQIISPKQVMIAKQHDKLNELFYSVY